MTDIINLRQARKQRARSEARSVSTARAAKFGRSNAEKALEEARADKARAALDGHKREPEAGEE